jgi:pre-mRNA-processing factor SLU7
VVPAELDEEGHEINPHIPQYIMEAPWYLSKGAPTLSHQRTQKQGIEASDGWYKRGVVEGTAGTKWRVGSCPNCGAMTHKQRDCIDRPRAKGARWTGQDLRDDEFVGQELNFTFDSKRDRWAGFNPSDYDAVIRRHEMVDAERKRLQVERVSAESAASQAAASEAAAEAAANPPEAEAKSKKEDDDSDDDEAREDAREKALREGAVLAQHRQDGKMKTTIRNLRIREDTAKYLRNLDINSAHYDPKTRSMRESPYDPNDTKHLYRGDNMGRLSGDALKFAAIEAFAWDSYSKGKELHTNAAPTGAWENYKEFKERRDSLKSTKKEAVLAKYGGAEHLETPSIARLAATESYVEYSRDGKVVQGQEKLIAKSKYEEDVFINNHTSVWGSWWINGKWGYRCCKSQVRSSYCLGQKGVDAADATSLPIQASSTGSAASHSSAEAHQQPLMLEAAPAAPAKEPKEKKSKKAEGKALKAALKAQSEKESSLDVLSDDRKRSYHSGLASADSSNPTEAQLEAYHLKKARWDDPMANMPDST